MRSWQRCLIVAVITAVSVTNGTAQEAPLGTPLPGKPIGTEIESDGGPEAFLESQLIHARVAQARDVADARLRQRFEDAGVAYPASEIYLRVFKHERVLEVWAVGPDGRFRRVLEYPVCALPGQLGPKERLGDFQVPEGFYFIDEFNPRSNYHLSLRVSYPNLSDRLRREAISLGGDIYVHGGCETVGCIPIEDDRIRELYWLAVQAMDAGQRVIPIHIFPSRMDDASLRWLERTYRPEPDLSAFWRNLAEGYAYFEATRQVPWITVDRDGHYTVPPFQGRLADADSAADRAVGPIGADPARPAGRAAVEPVAEEADSPTVEPQTAPAERTEPTEQPARTPEAAREQAPPVEEPGGPIGVPIELEPESAKSGEGGETSGGETSDTEKSGGKKPGGADGGAAI